ncbi:MAG TPA: hypothetical protein VH439_05685 [Gemmatimonadales bacterium]|jgi:endogenous inhibitor of DNA gyrase (YacG/DUF329 family)
MTLRCPHCGTTAAHQRRDVLGHFVICPGCQRHFEWEQARRDEPKPDLVPRDGEWDGMEEQDAG